MKPTELSRTVSVLWTFASGVTVFGALGVVEALSLADPPPDAAATARFGAFALVLLVGLLVTAVHGTALLGWRDGPSVAPERRDVGVELNAAATVSARLL
jgi:hypothetical protein